MCQPASQPVHCLTLHCLDLAGLTGVMSLLPSTGRGLPLSWGLRIIRFVEDCSGVWRDGRERETGRGVFRCAETRPSHAGTLHVQPCVPYVRVMGLDAIAFDAFLICSALGESASQSGQLLVLACDRGHLCLLVPCACVCLALSSRSALAMRAGARNQIKFHFWRQNACT